LSKLDVMWMEWEFLSVCLYDCLVRNIKNSWVLHNSNKFQRDANRSLLQKWINCTIVSPSWFAKHSSSSKLYNALKSSTKAQTNKSIFFVHRSVCSTMLACEGQPASGQPGLPPFSTLTAQYKKGIH
jgi:hypothetical protein